MIRSVAGFNSAWMNLANGSLNCVAHPSILIRVAGVGAELNFLSMNCQLFCRDRRWAHSNVRNVGEFFLSSKTSVVYVSMTSEES